MSEQITLDAEFLRRALGYGLDGDPTSVRVTPGTLPPDFPVPLPDLEGTRVLGGVRFVASRYTFGGERKPTELTQWRVFLDVPGAQAEVLRALTPHLEEEGWQAGQTMWRPAFVEASRSEWLGVHVEHRRMLRLVTRDGEGMTQVWVDVQDTEPEQLQGLLGHHPHPHFQDMENAPLPTLTVPGGWRVQSQGGSGGSERSERAFFFPPEGEAADLAALLAHLAPQWAEQGWQTLDLDAGESEVRLVARTSQGYGLLNLTR